MDKTLTLLIRGAAQVPSLLLFLVQGCGWPLDPWRNTWTVPGVALQSWTPSTSPGKTLWNGNSIQGMCNHKPRSKQEFNTTEVPFEPGRVKLSIKEKNRKETPFSNPPLNNKDIFTWASFPRDCIPHPALPAWEVPLLFPDPLILPSQKSHHPGVLKTSG